MHISHQLLKNFCLKIQLGPNTSLNNYLSKPFNYNFNFESANPVEVILIIDSLDTNKGSGPYSIPGDLLKLLKENLQSSKDNYQHDICYWNIPRSIKNSEGDTYF